MPCRVLRAVASAVTVTGALASAANDEVSLVQKEIRSSIMNYTDQEKKSAMGSLYGMFFVTHIEMMMRSVLKDVDVEGSDDGSAKCSYQERMDAAQMMDFDHARNMNDEDHFDSMLKFFAAADCKRTKMQDSVGAVSELGSCLIQQTQASLHKGCLDCSLSYYQGTAGGCTHPCFPLMDECKEQSFDDDGSLSRRCSMAYNQCFLCAYPHWRDFARCSLAPPGSSKAMQAMDTFHRTVRPDATPILQRLADLANLA